MDDDGWSWAVVEVFGHRRHFGRIREVEAFGTKMMRIDVPREGDSEGKGWETIHYAGAAIFSLAASDEATVMKANKPYSPAAPYRLTREDRWDEDEPEDDDGFDHEAAERQREEMMRETA